MKRLLLLVLLFVAQVLSKGEVLNKNIVVAPLTPRCKTRTPQTGCVKPTAFAKVDLAHVPADYQCPCEVTNAGDGTNGGIDGATGIPVQNNDDQDFFVDEVLAAGFDSPVAVAFSDNGKHMFVGERQGRVWNVDLTTGNKLIAFDWNKRVGFSGDRGLMDIKCHPNWDGIGHLLVMYTCDHDEEDGKEPDAESAQNQKIVRLNIDPNTNTHPVGGYEAEIIGGTLKAGGYASGVPLCYNTHALGEMYFGNDATLMVTTGEGAHWNFDMGDWGQDADGRVDPVNAGRIESLDAQCLSVFGPEQDVGSWRAQILNSLAGKVLRITPDAGEGICGGAQTGKAYETRNPFCNGPNDPGTSDKSRVWATGLRNPFRMTMRPFDAIKDKNPGVFYFGDVGQGGYEEINAVVKSGMNFGWPCWEGPLPSPMMRDSIYNDDPNHVFDHGCGGSEKVVAPCKAITTIARDEDGSRYTCPYMYYNKTTTLPFLYWTRYRANDNAGYFTENAYTGQGFYGATTAGLAFYSGKKYPSKYQGKLFALDFTEKWVKVISLTDDQYVSTMHFAELIHTLPTEGAKVTLTSGGPDGNICYLTMNGGEVRCFRYVNTNVAPVPIATVVQSAVNADNAQIQFSADGTADREGDEIAFFWTFGDGTNSTQANPLHTYVNKGTYTANLTATDSNGNKAMVSIPIITNNARPVVSITSPIPNLPGNLYQLGNGSVTFNMNVVDETPAAALTYYWEYKFVHNSHQHDKIGEQFTKTFTVNTLPDESAVERNSLKIIATATDAGGVSGSAWIMIARPDWMTAFGNKAPVATFITSIPTVIARVGQPITFDARSTFDPNGDYLTLTWSWGDGLFGNGLVTSHTYDVANTNGYVVKLNVTDNWGYSDSYTLTVPVTAAQAITPSSSVPSGPVYDDVTLVLSSIEPGALIYYELFQGDATNVDVTPASTLYSGPIKLSYTAGVTANLLIKARSANGGVPSETVRFVYTMVPPPCTTMGLGAAGNTSVPGMPFCVNPLNPGYPAGVVNVPGNDYSQVYTDFPPPNEPNGTRIIVYLMSGLNGTPAPNGALSSKYNLTYPFLWLNSGSAAGAIGKMMIEYDFTGDGTYDRREVYTNFAPDPVPSTWESTEIMFQRDPNGRFTPTSPTGTGYLPFTNGNIKISIWEAIPENSGGSDPIQFRIGNSVIDPATQIVEMSTIQFPYSSLYQIQNRAPGTPLPNAPPAYSGSNGWPTQPPVNTAQNTDQSRSSAATSNSAGTSAGVSAGTAGTNGTSNAAATSNIVGSSASSNSTSRATGGSQAASRGAEGTGSNSNVIVCSFFLIVLALL